MISVEVSPNCLERSIRPDNKSILKHLQRRCVKGIIFLLVNLGQWVEEGQGQEVGLENILYFH